MAKYRELFREPNAVLSLTRSRFLSPQVDELRALLVAGVGFEAIGYLLYLIRMDGPLRSAWIQGMNSSKSALAQQVSG